MLLFKVNNQVGGLDYDANLKSNTITDIPLETIDS